MNVGIGVMAMPTAFYNAGTGVGIAAMAFMATITVHCMHLLVSVF
jgi:amino acid permease